MNQMAVHLTIEELAARERTTEDTVHYWLKVGKAPRSFKVGRRRLFAMADVESWEEQARERSDAAEKTPA